VLLITLLFTLLSFAVSLLAGIVITVISAKTKGVAPDLTSAYRHIAVPAAMVVAGAAFVGASIMEIRHFRQSRILARIERSSS
jgi:hypothetical protein